ncbi:MAG: M1 family metallopeptidase [Flavobacteriales bacterium]|nr:M1 family metallopeptidase [Flavobacteriales bacterium]
MLKISKLITLCCILFVVACHEQPAPQNNERSERSKMLIANMKLARDPHTWSKPNDARVTHLHWTASVDFKSKVITATAKYDIQNISGTDLIIFDTKGLQVSATKVDGQPVQFNMGEDKPIIGQSLNIPIKADSKSVEIDYKTSPDAEALLWVEGEKPFLFTQSQAILARTWVPCQDSPGVRITYHADVTVPSDLMALMSAENPQQKSADGKYHFEMDQPIPSYLMALAVGDVVFREIGPRTGVYAIPSLADAAASEFSDMQTMVDEAEKLYGPYVWGRYDLLILPPAFPFGGMENPKLTFATPTIIAGDKSLVSLVAHELAHSWSGNLVTNSTWDDFWLNEGFTVYFEQRIMEAVYGRERSEMLATLSRQDLDATIADISSSEHPEDSKLKLALEGRSPDDGMTDIAYNKGYFFLRLIEETVGREKFDKFLKEYFTSHQFQVMDTETFLDYLRKNLVDAETEKKINIQAWVYEPGLPSNIPSVQSAQLETVDKIRLNWENKKVLIANIPWNNWSYQERYRFISNFSEDVTAADLSDMDRAFDISHTGNNEVLFAWLQQSILKKYEPAYPELEKFLVHVGRRKFVAPLFESMISSGQIELAKNIYTKARPNYHAVTIGTVDEMLAGK